ncbi:hypothetical protein SAMN04487894_11976, partial [Niabella drilacis]
MRQKRGSIEKNSVILCIQWRQNRLNITLVLRQFNLETLFIFVLNNPIIMSTQVKLSAK